MRKLLVILSLLVIFLLTAHPLKAAYDPTSVTNNRFGIHIADPVDLPDAARLVNSSGGDWGYVTFVIQKTERDTRRWQAVFDEARRLHLIPIVRIATRGQGINWEKPNFDEIDGWVSFLNSLNWVIKNRYVIVANEPNHVEEWGGELSPEEYAAYLKIFAQKLKATSEDFFILPAGLDASAPNSKTSLEESLFWERVISSQPDIFDFLDGLASHSYPNPGFTGSERGTGKGTVKTFVWELGILRNLGVHKNLPVFITETGWAHKAAGATETAKNPLLLPEVLGEKFKYAFQNSWDNKEVVAVTPFILSYQENPFDIFSWKDKSGNYYDFYGAVQKLPKVAGRPIQEVKGEISALFVPPFQILGSAARGAVLVKNLGQSIWSSQEVSLQINQPEGPSIFSPSFADIEPGGVGLFFFKAKPTLENGVSVGTVTLISQGKAISKTSSYQTITITPLSLQIQAIFAKIERFFKGQ